MNPLSGLVCMSIGQVTHDRYQDRILPGGCSFYAASVWQSLGCKTSMVTSMGKDFECHDYLSKFQVHADACEQTTTFVNRYDESGNRIQYVSTSGSMLEPAMLSDSPGGLDVLFFAPVLGEVEPGAWLDVLDARICGLGLQGLLRRAEDTGAEGSFRLVVPDSHLPSGRELGGIDVVFLSVEDMAGQPASLLEHLRENVSLVVLTRGLDGSTIWTRDMQIHVPAYPSRTVDPTGAGDTYAATFLAVLAANGFHRGKELGSEELAEAGRWAAAAAAIVVEGLGPLNMPKVSSIGNVCLAKSWMGKWC